MHQHEISVGSRRVSFRESSEAGNPVVLIHGNSFSTRVFDRQFDSSLAGKYRLIAFDLPGHGLSAKAGISAEYSLKGYSEMLVSAIRQLDLAEAVFIGWSLGGHVLLQAAEELPSSAGFVICGTPPLKRPFAPQTCFLPHEAGALLFREELSGEDVACFVSAACGAEHHDHAERFAEDIRRTDPAARSQLLASLLRGDYEDEVEIVQRLRTPLAVVLGEFDRLVSLPYLRSLPSSVFWRGEPQIICGSGHSPQWENAEAFNALVIDFLDDCLAVQRP